MMMMAAALVLELEALVVELEALVVELMFQIQMIQISRMRLVLTTKHPEHHPEHHLQHHPEQHYRK